MAQGAPRAPALSSGFAPRAASRSLGGWRRITSREAIAEELHGRARIFERTCSIQRTTRTVDFIRSHINPNRPTIYDIIYHVLSNHIVYILMRILPRGPRSTAHRRSWWCASVDKGGTCRLRRGFAAMNAQPGFCRRGGLDGWRAFVGAFVKTPDETHCMHLPLQHLRLVTCDARPVPGVCVRIAGLCKWQIGSVA